jgi:hypothetical protein
MGLIRKLRHSKIYFLTQFHTKVFLYGSFFFSIKLGTGVTNKKKPPKIRDKIYEHPLKINRHTINSSSF